MGGCCIFVCLCIGLMLLIEAGNTAYKNDVEARRKAEQTTKKKIESIEKALRSYDYILNENRSYKDIKKVYQEKNKIIELNKAAIGYDIIPLDMNKLEEWYRLSLKMKLCPLMSNRYGEPNKDILNKIRNLDDSKAQIILDSASKTVNNINKMSVLSIDDVAVCLWYFAMKKPFSIDKFNLAKNSYNNYYKEFACDGLIADLYSKYNIGSKEAFDNELNENIESRSYRIDFSNEKLYNLASFLMWIKNYKAEERILNIMVEKGIDLNERVQQRLHSLSAGGGNVEILSIKNKENLHVDLSSLSWRDENINALFDNLIFQEKRLDYACAVRDEDKQLILANTSNILIIKDIFDNSKKQLSQEYGAQVNISLDELILSSGANEEKMQGILLYPKDCKYLGIFAVIMPIGRKLNIKFYTLFLPESENAETQKQQMKSLINKFSPIADMWENSLKDFLLLTIQKTLNETHTKSHSIVIDNHDNIEF